MTVGAPTPDERAWLVVVDMQRIFASPQSQWSTPGFASILPANQRLIAAYGDRVVFTRFVAPDRPEGAWVDYYRDWPFALVPADDPIYDLVDGLPSAGHPVVSRPTFGKWDDRPGSLREVTRGASSYVISGVSTDCCVLSTALAAADAGVRVTVVSDACAGLSAADHERALAAMALYGPLITVRTTQDLLEPP